MKTLYKTPICEVIEIDIEDILCYSSGGDDGSNDQLSDLRNDVL